jgi:hypothetical protein
LIIPELAELELFLGGCLEFGRLEKPEYFQGVGLGMQAEQFIPGVVIDVGKISDIDVLYFLRYFGGKGPVRALQSEGDGLLVGINQDDVLELVAVDIGRPEINNFLGVVFIFYRLPGIALGVAADDVDVVFVNNDNFAYSVVIQINQLEDAAFDVVQLDFLGRLKSSGVFFMEQDV